MARPRVVIVGAGFGGLTCARALRHVPVDVSLIDRNNYHLFTPLLYQVASALLDPGEIARPIRSLIRGLRNVDFRMADVKGFDLQARNVITSEGEVAYDYLVIAAGSRTHWFGHDELARTAEPLKTLEDGLDLRNRILTDVERARWSGGDLTFTIAGGGPTGVEMAGALSELIRLVLARDFPDLDVHRVHVSMKEAGQRVLPAFAPALSDAARRSLEGKNVVVHLGAPVESVADGETLIWTAGVRGSELGESLGASRSGRVPVDANLRLPERPEVFVIGDLALARVDGQDLPMVAPVAIQQGKHVGRAIGDLVAGRPLRPFEYHDPGIMATIGRNAAVAQLGGIKLKGFPGWVFWLAVHLANVVTFRSRLLVLVNWAWEYLFYDRPVRLIVRARR